MEKTSKDNEELGLPPVICKKELERKRKRILANPVDESLAESDTEIPVIGWPPVKLPLERENDVVSIDFSPEKSRLESLPPKLLNRVICRVDYEDLKNLILVSKRISEAVIRAKEYFISPKKQFPPFGNAIGEFRELGNEENGVVEEVPPNGPNRERQARRISEEVLEGLRKQLF